MLREPRSSTYQVSPSRKKRAWSRERKRSERTRSALDERPTTRASLSQRCSNGSPIGGVIRRRRGGWLIVASARADRSTGRGPTAPRPRDRPGAPRGLRGARARRPGGTPLPARVSRRRVFSPYRIAQGPPRRDRTRAWRSVPASQAMSTSKPPRARSPLTEPRGHAAAGPAAGARRRAWLCRSISAMPAVPPKLPSIWNGGWVSKRLGSVDFARSMLHVLSGRVAVAAGGRRS